MYVCLVPVECVSVCAGKKCVGVRRFVLSMEELRADVESKIVVGGMDGWVCEAKIVRKTGRFSGSFFSFPSWFSGFSGFFGFFCFFLFFSFFLLYFLFV